MCGPRNLRRSGDRKDEPTTQKKEASEPLTWLTRKLGWILCLAGALTIIWALLGALYGCAILFLAGSFSFSSLALALGAACLGLCVTKLGLLMSGG